MSFKKEILQTLKKEERQCSTICAIIHTGCSSHPIERELEDLLKNGLVAKKGQLYTITNKGKALLSNTKS